MTEHKKAGRPFGSFALGEEKTERLEIAITPTAKAWLKSQKRGYLSDLVERLAREAKNSQ